MMSVLKNWRLGVLLALLLMPFWIVGLFRWFDDGKTYAVSRYASYQEAEQREVFKQGWLPDILPRSAKSITTRNNLDVSTSEGEFDCDSADLPAFVQKLTPYAGEKSPLVHFEEEVEHQRSQGVTVYQFRKENTLWVFFVKPGRGHVNYASWLISANPALP